MARGPRGPLIRIPRPRGRIAELESEGDFAHVMQQAEAAPGDQRRRIQLQVWVSHDQKHWEHFETVWEGYWRAEWAGGLPQLPTPELREIAGRSGFRYAQVRYASDLQFKF